MGVREAEYVGEEDFKDKASFVAAVYMRVRRDERSFCMIARVGCSSGFSTSPSPDKRVNASEHVARSSVKAASADEEAL